VGSLTASSTAFVQSSREGKVICLFGLRAKKKRGKQQKKKFQKLPTLAPSDPSKISS
jgi:hypothetical protein